MRFFLFFILSVTVYGKKLTLDQAVMDSPFKIASLGWHGFFPNENAILIKGQGDKSVKSTFGKLGGAWILIGTHRFITQVAHYKDDKYIVAFNDGEYTKMRLIDKDGNNINNSGRYVKEIKMNLAPMEGLV